MVTLGLASVVFAAFMLYRRQDIKRLFAYSSIEHMGVITFAFGMGGTLANFAGLMHMALHSLTKSAIFFCVGHIAQVKGTQRMADIRGLTASHPALGWSLGLGVVAIAGLPPMGLFMTEFLIVTSTFARAPALAVILGLALLVSLGALLLRLNGLAFGEPDARRDPDTASFLPIGLHLFIVLAAGIWLPPALVAWFQYVASLLS
jgi:hydrogenase-4 component F